MTTKETFGALEPHALCKRLVLRSYLDAWSSFLDSGNERLLVLDGFAGAGSDANGAPLIALESLLEHKDRGAMRASATLVLVELDTARCRHLEALVAARRSELPADWEVLIHNASFDESLTGVLDLVDQQRILLWPAFAMVDPFGDCETPLSVIRRFSRNEMAEVYISVACEAIDRFEASRPCDVRLERLLGCTGWREGLELESPADRRDFFLDLYERQLRAAGARHLVHLELYEEERFVGAIFFGSHYWRGADIMKKAVWEMARCGNFVLRGTCSSQLTLGPEGADFRPLREALLRRFQGKGWIDVRSLARFVGSDRTDYHTGQLETHALGPMEESGALEVDPAGRKGSGAFADGTRVRFR